MQALFTRDRASDFCTRTQSGEKENGKIEPAAEAEAAAQQSLAHVPGDRRERRHCIGTVAYRESYRCALPPIAFGGGWRWGAIIVCPSLDLCDSEEEIRTHRY